ncbi:GGGtGRT protein [Photobacterium sp. DNB23_23_1]
MAALFENYDRRINQIQPLLNQYGFNSLEDAFSFCKEHKVNPYDIVKDTQPIAFENAAWAYVLGAAIAFKEESKNAAQAAELIGEGLQAFCIPGAMFP